MIDFFLKYLQYEKNYSFHTVLSYRNDLEEFSSFIQSQKQIFDPIEVDSKIIREWIVFLMDNKIAPRSVNRKISTLKSFYRFLVRRNLILANPAKKITSLKTGKNLPLFFKESEMENTLASENLDTGFESYRNKLIIAMFYETGIRLSELIEIKDSDVDLSIKTIRVLGKRKKQRIIPFGEQLYKDIICYKEIRDKEIDHRTSYLYVRKNGERMYPKLV